MYIYKYIDTIKSNLNKVCPDAHRKKINGITNQQFLFSI